MSVVGIIAFCCVLCVLPIAIVARIEKRMIWPYGVPQAQPRYSDISGYGYRWVNDAYAAGWTFYGWAPDIKGPRYKIDYAFLLSPEGDTLAIVGVGTLMGIPLAGTWLYSAGTNDRVVYSCDNQNCVEIDISRRWKSQLVRAKSFNALYERHKELPAKNGVVPRPFSRDGAFEEFRSIREEHFQAMAREGLLAFTDASATHWSYTMRGAVKFAFLNYAIGLLRAVTFGRLPASA